MTVTPYDYFKERGVRLFKEFPRDLVCPVCHTNHQECCLLLGIDKTSDGSIEEAKPVHLLCAIAQRFSPEAGIIYRRIE